MDKRVLNFWTLSMIDKQETKYFKIIVKLDLLFVNINLKLRKKCLEIVGYLT